MNNYLVIIVDSFLIRLLKKYMYYGVVVLHVSIWAQLIGLAGIKYLFSLAVVCKCRLMMR